MNKAGTNSSLEEIYRVHHASNRGEGFTLLGDVRGAFLRERIGTGKCVLDIGCRDGSLTSTYASGNSVTGIDIDSVALARAKNELGITTILMDLNGPWDIERRSFDVVVAAEVLEHLYYPDKVVEKIATLLNPDGVFVGSVPNAFSMKHRMRYMLLRKRHTPLADPTHINHFTVSEIRGILERHFHEVCVIGTGRTGLLARLFPQTFAFDLLLYARGPR